MMTRGSSSLIRIGSIPSMKSYCNNSSRILHESKQQIQLECCSMQYNYAPWTLIVHRTYHVQTKRSRRGMMLYPTITESRYGTLRWWWSVAVSNTIKGATITTTTTTVRHGDVPKGTEPNKKQQQQQQQQQQTPSFQVAKISYQDGSIEFLRNITITDLLHHCPSVYARDLFTLNVTSRQERSKHRAIFQQSSVSTELSNAAVVNPRRSVSVLVSRNKQAILVSLGIIRAVATVNHVFLFEIHNPAVRTVAMDIAQTYQKHIAARIHKSDDGDNDNNNACASAIRNEPNELIFLEYVLRDTAESYNRRLRLYEPICENILENVTNQQLGTSGKSGRIRRLLGIGNMRPSLSSSYDISVVQQLVPLKDSLQSFEIQVKQTIDCISEVLNNDDTMLSLLLTEQQQASQAGTEIDFIRHEHVELLMGVYARQISTISMEITYLLNRIQSKQELVALSLSSYRNRMVQLNLHLNIAALAIGFCTVIAGFFGMNVVNGYEASTVAFPTIVIGSAVGGVTISMICLQLVDRKSMHELAMKKMDQINTLTLALSDMPALDYALKNIMEHNLLPLNRNEFGNVLKSTRQSNHITQPEVDLLFDIFDQVKDGTLSVDDFHNHHQHYFQTTTASTSSTTIPTKNLQ